MPDLAGKRFGRLLVNDAVDRYTWRCICDCGSSVEIRSAGLTYAKTQSCGCLQRDTAAALKRTHGLSGTRTHNIWDGIIQRCTNPKNKHWKDYGGRGIAIEDPRWLMFDQFFADMGEAPAGLSIERRENSRGYCKDNCEWATRKEQQRNRRTNRLITFEGRTVCLAEWLEERGVSHDHFYARLKSGMTELQALNLG